MRSLVGARAFALALQAVVAVTSAGTQTLYATSFEGTLTTLSLTESNAQSDVSLRAVSTRVDCGPRSSWLTLDSRNSVLYCLDESWEADNGTITSYRVAADGALTQLDNITTIDSPVSASIYGEGGRGLAVSYFDGGGFGTFDISDPSNIKSLQTFLYPPVNGKNSSVHQAVLDPNGGHYFIAPDLGQDLVRVYGINQTSLELTEASSAAVTPGSGPRHAAVILNPQGTTYMFLLAEKGNTITAYRLVWSSCQNVLTFHEQQKLSTHGEPVGETTVPALTSAGEIVVSPDQRYLIVSSRGENSLQIPSFSGNSTTKIPSDPIINFKLNPSNGALELLQIAPAGGRTPRHFSLNKAGDRVAVGLQADGRVVIIERNVTTGLLGDFVAVAEGLGGDLSINNVIFRE